jgi:hypothetical protein
VTWAFIYLVALVVGLMLASVTGLLRDLKNLSRHHHLIVPHPDQQSAFLALVGRRLAIGSFLFGLVGLALGARRVPHPSVTFGVALGAGLVGVVLGVVLYRRPRVTKTPGGSATVVRDIPPGGYGQVRLEREGRSFVLAAQNIDQAPIPAGAEVEVVDSTRSVVTVRKPTRG